MEPFYDRVLITWNEDAGHKGNIPIRFLQENCYDSTTLKNRDASLKPKYNAEVKFPVIHFDELEQSLSSSKKTEALLRLMTNIVDHGSCLVKDTPVDEDTAVMLAEMIAPVQRTIYGKTFDVVSTPEPINIAYSSVKLDLHMDLAYYESPPGLQVFHCLRFDDCVEGGDSLFLDAFQIAEEFRESFPAEFQDLTKIPATFQKIHFKRERPVLMTYQRPHITLNHRKQITGVFWSPAFEGPLYVPKQDVEPYYKAYRLFMKAIHQSQHLKTTHLSPGDAMIFSNRRLLHGRSEFKLNGGVRQFKTNVHTEAARRRFGQLNFRFNITCGSATGCRVMEILNDVTESLFESRDQSLPELSRMHSFFKAGLLCKYRRVQKQLPVSLFRYGQSACADTSGESMLVLKDCL